MPDHNATTRPRAWPSGQARFVRVGHRTEQSAPHLDRCGALRVIRVKPPGLEPQSERHGDEVEVRAGLEDGDVAALEEEAEPAEAEVDAEAGVEVAERALALLEDVGAV